MDETAVMPADFESKRKITFPCANVRLVDAGKVQANDYNPNHVATAEMEGLAHSISSCGVTQPIVTYYDDELDRYIVVDGFHRYVILVHVFECQQIPVVVIQKNIGQRIASTIRHNKAKGEHKVDLMGHLVGRLLGQGLADDEIAARLGMEEEEVLRLKQNVRIA